MSLTLEAVESAFIDWRASRKSRSESIPQELKDMVRQLIPHYKKSHICKALGLSGGQLKQVASSALLKSNPVSESDQFIQAALPMTSYCEFSITGDSKTLTCKLPVQDLQKVLPLMVGCL